MDRSPTGPFRIVIVDDEPSIRRGLQIRLDTEPDLQVVGTTATGAQAIELVRDLRPDLVLMDVRLPAMDGFAATTARRRACPAIPVVLLTLYDDVAARHKAAQVGAAAFVSKHEGDAALLRAVREQLAVRRDPTAPHAPTVGDRVTEVTAPRTPATPDTSPNVHDSTKETP